MKKLLFQRLALTILVTMLLPCMALASETPASLRQYTLVSENEYLQLYINEETTEVAVLERSTSHIWFSSPQNLAATEKIKRGNARDGMRATLVLSYYTPERESRTLNSYLDSVRNNEFEISEVEGGVRIDYILGKKWTDEAYIPVMIARDKFEAILEKVEDSDDREILQEDYSLLTLQETSGDPYERVNVYGIDPRKVFGSWDLVALSGPVIGTSAGLRNSPEERKRYLLERFADTVVTYRADYDMRSLITADNADHLRNAEFYALLEATYPRFDKPEIARIFREVGYTPEDVAEDHIIASLDPPVPNPEVFRIPVIFRLDGPNVVVTIPAAEIEYPIDLMTDEGDLATFMPQSIDLLQWFGAAGTNASGYMLLPDRSGALMSLNNQKKLNLPSFFGNVYGADRSTELRTEEISQGALIRLPVYGLKEGDRAFFTVIEDGQAIAYIRAELAGKTDSFNKVWCGFTLTPRATVKLWGVRNENQQEAVSIADDRLVDVYQARPYQGDVTLRISFLTGDAANYAGMASAYRSYLVERHGLSKIPSDSDLPFYLELIGGIHKQVLLLGAPREVVVSLTSFAEARRILSELDESGVKGIKVRYLGWTKGGIHHYFPDRVAFEKALGTRSELDELIAYASARGVAIFPDIDLTTVYRNTLFDGYQSGRDAARFLNRDAVRIYDYNIATFQRIPEQSYEILSPSRLSNLLSSFLPSFQQFGFGGISLRTTARNIYSDFRERPEELTDRQQSARANQQVMERLVDSGLELMVAGGIDLAFPYARHIVGAPTEGSKMYVFDESIPFYQMVLHGYIDFAGEPFNSGESYSEMLLRCLETGESPYYRWSYADSSAIKDTQFNYLLSIQYAGWFDEAVAMYHEVSSVLNRVRGQCIVGHEKLAEGVYQTTYENGLAVVVNYTAEDYRGNGFTVSAGGYSVLEREGEL